ncbi:MAG: 4Fe-4S dicluster domain-containing protein [Armatimonadetes bacterium]|nr:4Fe-4S dicluster domain-containing protein [Armatimonadota bacterium]
MSDLERLSDLTTRCIRCGFCLESCPTFRLTGDEAESPRGRIYLVRSVLEQKLDWDDASPHLQRCLGCRGCETACPSGVQYGQILEGAREQLDRKHPNLFTRLLLKGLTNPRLAKLLFQSASLLPHRKMPGLISKWVSGHVAEAQMPLPDHRKPWPPLDLAELPPIDGRVGIVLGCVMRVLYDPVHEATKRLVRRVGFEPVEITADCCGALHSHAGLVSEARTRAFQMAKQFPPGPVIVNSAGCGSTIKEWSHLDPTLSDAASHVTDLTEFLHDHGLVEELSRSKGVRARVAYHPACHLLHGQKIHRQPVALIRAIPGLEYVDLPNAELCCGSAGIYNVLQPKLARELIEEKWRAIEVSGAEIIVTGNPGCLAWIQQKAREANSRVEVIHTAELLERSFSGS